MDKNSLDRILQKAEEYEKRRQDKDPLQDQTDEARLERIRQKAEEYENLKKRDLEWNDKIEAIRETYGLSEEELKTIIQEVTQKEQNTNVPPPFKEKAPKTLSDKLKSLFFSPKGRIGRGTFALSMAATVIFQGFVFSLSTRGLPPLGLLALVGLFSQIMLYTKRFHDLNKSGLCSISLFIPGINILAFLYLLLAQGDEHPNPYDEVQ